MIFLVVGGLYWSEDYAVRVVLLIRMVTIVSGRIIKMNLFLFWPHHPSLILNDNIDDDNADGGDI